MYPELGVTVNMSKTQGADPGRPVPVNAHRPSGTVLGPLCQQLLFYLLVYGEKGGRRPQLGGMRELKAVTYETEGITSVF